MSTAEQARLVVLVNACDLVRSRTTCRSMLRQTFQ